MEFLYSSQHVLYHVLLHNEQQLKIQCYGKINFYLWQDCCSEVEGVRHLTESCARDDTDPRLLQQIEGVEDVGCLAGLLSRLYCLEQKNSSSLLSKLSKRADLLWQDDLWEGVHGSLDCVAAEAWDGVEGLRHQFGSPGEAGQRPVLLRQPGVVAGLPWAGWVDHQVHTGLAQHCRTQLG